MSGIITQYFITSIFCFLLFLLRRLSLVPFWSIAQDFAHVWKTRWLLYVIPQCNLLHNSRKLQCNLLHNSRSFIIDTWYHCQTFSMGLYPKKNGKFVTKPAYNVPLVWLELRKTNVTRRMLKTPQQTPKIDHSSPQAYVITLTQPLLQQALHAQQPWMSIKKKSGVVYSWALFHWHTYSKALYQLCAQIWRQIYIYTYLSTLPFVYT